MYVVHPHITYYTFSFNVTAKMWLFTSLNKTYTCRISITLCILNRVVLEGMDFLSEYHVLKINPIYQYSSH